MRKLAQGTIKRGQEDLEGQGYTKEEIRKIQKYNLKAA